LRFAPKPDLPGAITGHTGKKIIVPTKFFPVSPDKDCKRPRDKLAS
jgi:hypothetical protein